MNEKTFRVNMQYRDELKAMLEHPTMKLALQIIGERAKARKLPSPAVGVPLDTLMSHRLHKNWGIQHAIDRLALLTEPYDEEAEVAEEEEEDEFFHTLDSKMQAALKKQRQQS